MMDQNLIAKYFCDECTDEELSQIHKYVNDEGWGMEELGKIWNVTDTDPYYREEDKLRNLKQIRKKAKYKKFERKFSFRSSNLLRVAAILLTAVSLILLMLDLDKPQVSEDQLSEMIAKSNPAGHKSIHYLPDGSIVKLNAGSEISYLEKFGSSYREVYLMGEAFFDVAENPEKPFLVNSRGVVTKAVGTSFNVKAFMEDDMIEVVLASGKVEVSGSDSTLTTLLPGEEVIYYNHCNSYMKQKADLEKALAWRENLLIFDKATSEEMFTQLERWYGVEFVVCQEAIREPWRFSGRFKNESLENILLSLSYVKSFEFSIDNKTIYIKP